MNYKRVEIKDGNSTEPVQYVGVYALKWQKEWGEPEVGFVEIDEIACPFCEEDGFDKPGLKHHLNNYCEVYPDVEDI